MLDFVNDPQEILDSFKPYYRAAQLEAVTDPNIVHELQTKLDGAGVYYPAEVEGFAKAFFDPKRKQANLHAHLKPAVERFRVLAEENEEKADQFRKDLGAFLRLYDFLSQIIAYGDADLEKRHVFAKHLAPQVAERGQGSGLPALDSDVRLTHYRLQKLGQQALDLSTGDIVKLSPLSELGTGAAKGEEQARLAEIVGKMNDLFGSGVSEADLVGALATWKGKLLESPTLAAQAANNTESQFAMGDFRDVFADVVIDGQDKHNRIADQMLRDERIFTAMQGMLAKMVYQAFRQGRAA